MRKTHGRTRHYYTSRGGLNYLLRNRIYLGEITHRGKTYPGQHEAIIGTDLFEAAQAKLAAAAPQPPLGRTKGRHAFLLGKLFDDAGNPMTSAHANKAGKRYFYYVSTALNTGKTPGIVARISAPKIEQAIADIVAPMLSAYWRPEHPSVGRTVAAIQRIVVRADRLEITLLTPAIDLGHLALPDIRHDDETACFEKPLRLHRTKRARTLIASTDRAEPMVDRALVRALAMSRRWVRELSAAEAPSLRSIAKRESVCPSYARQILPLAFLAPDLVETILAGTQPDSLSLAALITAPLPVLWDEQRTLIATFA